MRGQNNAKFLARRDGGVREKLKRADKEHDDDGEDYV